jgi:hypothetical protein
VTYVVPKVLITSIAAASLTLVLLFGRTVLSVKRWKYIFFEKNETTKRKFQKQEKSKPITMATSARLIESRSRSRSQSLVQLKLSKWNNDNLINKKVFSCEKIDIGYISTVENRFMTIMGNGGRQAEYVIPTYYVREYDEERVLIDTSVKYLDRYQVK